MEENYLTGSHGSVSSISFQSTATDHNQPVSRGAHPENFRGNGMSAGSCRCTAANRELRTAQNMYETRATARSKCKIVKMEAAVKHEEVQRQGGFVAEEVDWLTDPGMPAKRATRFTRTKAESWRIKTLLAKALDAKEEGTQRSGKGYPASENQSADPQVIHESMDCRITAVQEGVEVINKKLTVLIRLLRQTLSPDPLLEEQRMQEAQDFHSMQELQAKVDKHILDVGLDTTSRIGGFPHSSGLP